MTVLAVGMGNHRKISTSFAELSPTRERAPLHLPLRWQRPIYVPRVYGYLQPPCRGMIPGGNSVAWPEAGNTEFHCPGRGTLISWESASYGAPLPWECCDRSALPDL